MKTSFLTSPKFWKQKKTLFWHRVTLFVFSKIPKKHCKNGETVKMDQFLTLDLDQFLTLETPNLGPVFNSTTYTYMLSYMPTPSPNRSFSRQTLRIWQDRKQKKGKTKRKVGIKWKIGFPQKTENSQKRISFNFVQKCFQNKTFYKKWPQATHLAM